MNGIWAGCAAEETTEASYTDSLLGRMIRERKLDDLLEDLETLDRVSASFVSSELRERESDLILRKLTRTDPLS